MRNNLLLIITLSFTIISCRKAIEPLDFNSNPIDPESGIVLKMVEIDSVNKYMGTFSPYKIIYFHLNFDQFPKTFGTPKNIDIYFNQVYLAYRTVSYTNNKYSFYIYGGSANDEYGFIITSFEERETDMQIPIVP